MRHVGHTSNHILPTQPTPVGHHHVAGGVGLWAPVGRPWLRHSSVLCPILLLDRR